MLEELEHQIQHAVGQYLQVSDELPIAPMVSNFVVLAEVTTPDGEMRMATIKADQLPLWTEAGMLTLHLDNIRSYYASYMVMHNLYHDHDEEEY